MIFFNSGLLKSSHFSELYRARFYLMNSIENCWVIWFTLFTAIWYFSSGVLAWRLQTMSGIHFKVLMNTYEWSIGVVDKLLVYMGLYWLSYRNQFFAPWNNKLSTTPIFDSSRHETIRYRLQHFLTYRLEKYENLMQE